MQAEFEPGVAAAAIAQLAAERKQAEAAIDAIYPGNVSTYPMGMDTDLPLQHRLEALSMAIAEDIAVVQINPDGTDRNAFLSIAAPSRWAPEEKIGRSFIATHTPVPHMAKTLSAAGKLQQMLIEKGPFVRFTWGIATPPALAPPPVQTQPPYARRDAFLRLDSHVLPHVPDQPALYLTLPI